MNVQNRKMLWLRTAAPVAVLAVALTACDDGGSDKISSSKDNTSSSTGTASKLQDDKADDHQLGAGQSATVTFKEDDGSITYSVVAQKVDFGTEADTRKLVSDPEKAKGFVPVVAHVKYTNKGGGAVSSYPSVGDNVEIYADGARGSILIGASDDAPGCESDSDIENWAEGQSHVICETYMIPKGARDVAVHWVAEDSHKPYVWTFKNS
ncbi:hypothetical protein [Streptomyces sp. NPDC058268]|uniref:hypothetical protein n=1 Tax=Streptomyces sp. NPDC058268 TaxID=3346413 RepID=UPI0036E2C629